LSSTNIEDYSDREVYAMYLSWYESKEGSDTDPLVRHMKNLKMWEDELPCMRCGLEQYWLNQPGAIYCSYDCARWELSEPEVHGLMEQESKGDQVQRMACVQSLRMANNKDYLVALNKQGRGEA